MSRRRCGRRALLASLAGGGLAALGGCASLGSVGQDEGSDPPKAFDSEVVERVLSATAPTPADPVPVDPDPAAVEAGLARVDDLLSTVPADVPSETVPNGVIRERIEARRTHAVEKRRAVVDAATDYRALQGTRSARREAARPAGTLQAIRGETTLAAARERRAAAVSAAERTAVPHAGERRDRTAFLAAELEAVLDDALGAGRDQDEVRERETRSLQVGEVVATTEYVRASVAVATHLADRHRARVSDQRTFRPAIERAAERSITALAERDLPEPDASPEDVADVDPGPGYEALEDLLWRVPDVPETVRESATKGRYAMALRAAYRGEVAVRAFDHVRDRVEAGELTRLSSVEPVRAAREHAIRQAASVDIDPGAPTVPASVFASTLAHLADVDDGLEEAVRENATVELTDFRALYALVAARLRVLPEAVAAVESRFD